MQIGVAMLAANIHITSAKIWQNQSYKMLVIVSYFFKFALVCSFISRKWKPP